MKKLLLFSSVSLLCVGQLFAQSMLTLVTSSTPATACTAPCNGTATVTSVTGGTPPYTYLWNPAGQNTQTATGLCPGQHQVGVWDASTPLPKQGTVLVNVICTTTGINVFDNNANVSVFPNPVSDKLSIGLSNLSAEGIKEIFVFNALGEKVLNQKFSNNLFVGNLPAGIYFLELKNENSSYRTKFIKE